MFVYENVYEKALVALRKPREYEFPVLDSLLQSIGYRDLSHV